ncbi:unnamed protein product [Tilletia laevis]|uniref:Uncharacterized protein n=2 Tax=Tilletia TaxID=13289 RepID=A0A9N8LYC8_9BASI|nr:hypothetical protein CF336_g7962 [Tilletia laevis]KAE8255096.1 hypothetical protein A4X03_0g5614 [Tilletia caries]CAD6895925.1 unnamed protein product [Tilletia controversa]CAD6922579.1 unnamed protein product [Tilletia laevis]CAD6947923.1 unnamed protein product [Tilletia laevis]
MGTSTSSSRRAAAAPAAAAAAAATAAFNNAGISSSSSGGKNTGGGASGAGSRGAAAAAATAPDHVDPNSDMPNLGFRRWSPVHQGPALADVASSLLACPLLSLLLLRYAYFAPSGCGLDQFFISVNLALVVILTVLCIHPVVQEVSSRSGLAQSSMVAAYCTYLIASALMNRDECTQQPHDSRPRRHSQDYDHLSLLEAIPSTTTSPAPKAVAQPTPSPPSPPGKDSLRMQALMAAVKADSLPASALDEEDEDEDDASSSIFEGTSGSRNENDDEGHGTRYTYAFFHLIFDIAACYVAMLLTDWRFVKLAMETLPIDDAPAGGAPIVFIGRSPTAMWMGVVSSWLCIAIYTWSLIAPVLLPNRFGLD